MEFFYPTNKISQEQVRLDLDMVNGKPNFIGDELTLSFFLYEESLSGVIFPVNEFYNCFFMAFSLFFNVFLALL